MDDPYEKSIASKLERDRDLIKVPMKEKRAFYHWLFAGFPVLSLYSYNTEVVVFQVIFIPLLVCLAWAFLAWLVLWFRIKDKHKAALLTFLFCFMFFSYGHFVQLLKTTILRGMREPPILMVVWVTVFIWLGHLAAKSRRSFSQLTSILNVSILALILFSLVKIVTPLLIPAKAPELQSGITTAETQDWIPNDLLTSRTALPPKTELPDVYYLIFDRYGANQILQQYFGFDNSDFLNHFKDLGFFVASNSLCNYPASYLSLSSALNMRYLNSLVRDKRLRKEVVHGMLQDHKVGRLLKSIGYKYLHAGGWWKPTRKNKYADINFHGKWSLEINREFAIELFELSLFRGVFKKSLLVVRRRKALLRTFDQLAKVPEMKGPKFVFAHILLPHRPYIFESDGSPLKGSARSQKTPEENYINQLRFTNTKIKWLVSEILRKSKSPPIIVIQSDEGPRKEDISLKNLQKKFKGREEMKRIATGMRCRILNMYYLPGVGSSSLYESITPVNSFRLIFNLYFGADLEYLEDRTYVPVLKKKIVQGFQLIQVD